DRDHRRRRRSGAPLFQPGGLHDAARVPQGEHDLHDREGDRRARVRAAAEHATHVAGIAAGDYTPGALPNRGPLSGVAPRAYLGNYKVLTVPTENFGLNGNAPEIAAGVEAAVRDGMDVINLSLGEPEIEPSRDLVVAAINAAADAGVVPTIAAGNEFADWGKGSISSPG